MIDFSILGFIVLGLWGVGMILLFFHQRKCPAMASDILAIIGTLLLALFTAHLWITLKRPPLRTLGETRLWYALLLSTAGIVIRFKWKLKWFLLYSQVMAAVFILLNIIRPELFDKTLRPALQSIWFVPHVIVYIEGYALLAGAAIFGARGLYLVSEDRFDETLLHRADNLVYFGFAFLTFGLLLGAVWAKEAWGHYWTWDPKETWAFLTWLSYLIYIHLRFRHPRKQRTALWFLTLTFIVLLICWFGVNYLPSARNSVHVYTR